MDKLINILEEQAKEVATAGINGWGNTMQQAADRIRELEAELANSLAEQDQFSQMLQTANNELAALRQQQGEPVAWCVAYDDPQLGRIHSNPTMCKDAAIAIIDNAGAELCLVNLYTHPTPSTVPDGWQLVPKEPTRGRLMSRAIRYDHGLGMPGYYDSEIFKGTCTHKQRVESALRVMYQLYEEAIGQGFYNPEREDYYLSLAAAPKLGDK